MAAIVTMTVAACLDTFGLQHGRYECIEEQNRRRQLPLHRPSDDDVVQLVTEPSLSWSQSGLRRQGSPPLDNMHQHDFVCLEPESPQQLYDIAQVRSLEHCHGNTRMTLTRMVRVQGKERVLEVGSAFTLDDHQQIKRTCWVAAGPDSTDCDFTTESPMTHCSHCLSERIKRKRAAESVRRLRTLSIFGGAGGMDVGLSFSHFRTDWMVDMSSVSCATFRMHHPAAAVIDKEAGEALRERATLAGMPSVGEVDAIIMGAPCQPFSKMNRQSRQQREKDPRSLCIATGLSYIEVYRPPYGIIENVCGILENGNLGNEEKTGIIKFVLVCLAALGYQARMAVVQCSGFGIPQGRKRVIILFAKEGLRLPTMPLPTHGSASGLGLYPAVTIADATSDLPAWDLTNPQRFSPSTYRLKEGRRHVPTSFSIGSNSSVLGPLNCTYASPPENAFQQQMRIAGSTLVDMHHTIPPLHSPLLTVEQIWQIPTTPSSNHLALQGTPVLAMPELLDATDESVFQNSFRRLDAKGQFPIITTSIALRGKAGRMIMPRQHRIPSIRELARAQGFPDGITFTGTPAEMLQQIGNAVPVPLATALAHAITAAVVDDALDGQTSFLRSRRGKKTGGEVM